MDTSGLAPFVVALLLVVQTLFGIPVLGGGGAASSEGGSDSVAADTGSATDADVALDVAADPQPGMAGAAAPDGGTVRAVIVKEVQHQIYNERNRFCRSSAADHSKAGILNRVRKARHGDGKCGRCKNYHYRLLGQSSTGALIHLSDPRKVSGYCGAQRYCGN